MGPGREPSELQVLLFCSLMAFWPGLSCRQFATDAICVDLKRDKWECGSLKREPPMDQARPGKLAHDKRQVHENPPRSWHKSDPTFQGIDGLHHKFKSSESGSGCFWDRVAVSIHSFPSVNNLQSDLLLSRFSGHVRFRRGAVDGSLKGRHNCKRQVAMNPKDLALEIPRET